MNLIFRRCSIGILSGAAASTALTATPHHALWNLILGVGIGAAYSAGLKPTRGAYVDNLLAGASLGVPLWGLVSVIAIPLLSGQMPEWSAEQMRQKFPRLGGLGRVRRFSRSPIRLCKRAPNISSVQSPLPKYRKFQ